MIAITAVTYPDVAERFARIAKSAYDPDAVLLAYVTYRDVAAKSAGIAANAKHAARAAAVTKADAPA